MDENYKFIDLDFTKYDENEMLSRSIDFYKEMNKRRTVREISSEQIPDEVLKNLILTAGTAPSGANKQPWFFCLVKDDKIKQKIRKEAETLEEYNYTHRYSGKWQEDLDFMKLDHKKPFLTEAPALIVAFKKRYSMENGEISKNYYISESSGIALGLLFAAIQNAGLVTVPYTPMPRAFLNEILDRPRTENALIILPVGYPKEGAKVPDKQRKPLENIMKEY